MHPPSPLTVNIVNGTQIKNISDITSLFYVLLSLNYKLLLFLYFLVKIVVALLCGFMYTLFNNSYFLCRFTRNSCHLVIHKPRGHFLGIFDTPSIWGHFYKLRLMQIVCKVGIWLTPSPKLSLLFLDVPKCGYGMTKCHELDKKTYPGQSSASQSELNRRGRCRLIYQSLQTFFQYDSNPASVQVSKWKIATQFSWLKKKRWMVFKLFNQKLTHNYLVYIINTAFNIVWNVLQYL